MSQTTSPHNHFSATRYREITAAIGEGIQRGLQREAHNIPKAALSAMKSLLSVAHRNYEIGSRFPPLPEAYRASSREEDVLAISSAKDLVIKVINSGSSRKMGSEIQEEETIYRLARATAALEENGRLFSGLEEQYRGLERFCHLLHEEGKRQSADQQASDEDDE